MILIEGCDGSGKSSLAALLSKTLDIPLHERAATSVGGPRSDLYEWTRRDFDTMYQQECAIYDRHPFVSEFIYGPIVRHSMAHDFYSLDAAVLFRKFVRNVFIIFCDPGLVAVTEAISRSADNQLAGVDQNVPQLYYAYAAYRTMWQGKAMIWDYRHPANFDAIKAMCTIQRDSWENSFHYA